MFLKSKKLELSAFRRRLAKAVFVKALFECRNPMHVEYCVMISNTILVDTAGYRFIFERLQNIH